MAWKFNEREREELAGCLPIVFALAFVVFIGWLLRLGWNLAG